MMERILGALSVSASGLRAQRIRMDTIAENIANANTTRDIEGRNNPYRRKDVVFAAGMGRWGAEPGVSVADIVEDAGFELRHEPDHPDADAAGYVKFPRIRVIQEMVDMMLASRSYEANITAMETTKAMFAASLRIIA